MGVLLQHMVAIFSRKILPLQPAPNPESAPKNFLCPKVDYVCFSTFFVSSSSFSSSSLVWVGGHMFFSRMYSMNFHRDAFAIFAASSTLISPLWYFSAAFSSLCSVILDRIHFLISVALSIFSSLAISSNIFASSSSSLVETNLLFFIFFTNPSKYEGDAFRSCTSNI